VWVQILGASTITPASCSKDCQLSMNNWLMIFAKPMAANCRDRNYLALFGLAPGLVETATATLMSRTLAVYHHGGFDRH
jgi:hypothetical protein